MKEGILTGLGVIGGMVASFFGGWDAGLAALIIFMAVDFGTGILVAGVFKKSKKTETGALASNEGFKGVVKKFMCVLIVGVAYQLDAFIGSSFIRDAVIIAFITNEVISIVENAGLMGIPVPAVISKAIDILNRKENNVTDKSDEGEK